MTAGVNINVSNCKKFALVIPTLNEAANITIVLGRTRRALSQLTMAWEILVVDDDSTDGTAEAVERYSAAHPEVRLLERHERKGLAGAITFGWKHTEADVVGVMDADLQHPPELLPELVNRVCQGPDIAIGSRYLQADSMAAWNWPRRLISRLSVLASKPVQRPGLRVHDPMSGFFVLRRECISGIEFQPAGFKLLLEVLAKARLHSVAEIPFTFGTRNGGKSKADGMTAVHYFSLLCRLAGEKVIGRRASVHPEDDSPATPSAEKIAKAGSPSAKQRTRSLEVILGLLPLVLGMQLLVWIVYLPVALRGNADFRNCYTAGVILRSGQGLRLYDYELQKSIQDRLIAPSSNVLPYVHLPYEALLYAPLSVFTYGKAFLCFLGLNVLCLLGCYRALKGKLGRLHALWWCFPFLFLIGFAPVVAALVQGQDSLITLLFLATALVGLEAGNDALAGFLVGLAMFKFQLVLPIAALFFLWRRWRFVLGASLSIFLTLAVSTLMVGVHGMVEYVRSFHNISTTFMAGGRVLYRMPVSRMPNLRGFISAIPHLSSGAATALVLILSVILFGLAAWSGRRASTQWQLAIAVPASAVIGYHVLTHDLSVLLIPMAMLVSQREARGLWSITAVWLATPFCFFAYDPWVAVPVLALFLGLVWQLWRTSTDNSGVSKDASTSSKS